MVGGEQGEFLISVQSSLTSAQHNETWWRMEAWHRGGIGKSDYEVHGTMLKEVNSTIVRRQDTQEMTYTVTFSGNHQSESAPLPMQGLVWEKPGSGPPMKPFQFFTVEIPGFQGLNSTPTSKPTSSATSTGTETTATIPTPTSTPKPGDEESPLPRGAITGIVVGGVLAIVVFMVIFFLVEQWLAKKKEPKVYPEVAYIYSTPFTSRNKRGQSAAGGPGASSATVGTSRGASAPHEAGTYYGPAAPQLEMDLGDQAPFLPAVAAIGSPGRGERRGLALVIERRSGKRWKKK
ncbi:hypothetical protein EV426DRAFT_581294 [Tirmania nivea]|nr:hypothetical protein EV426DRAFT_581294 [Tirmania nivea]